jgi:hypothetical protein
MLETLVAANGYQTIHVPLLCERFEQLAEAAREQGLTPTAFARMIIYQYLRGQGLSVPR